MQNELKTILYCRVANPDDEAIALQERTLRDYANKHGYENITVYADNGFKGINFNRPAFSRLSNDIQSKTVDTVIVLNMSCLSRNTIDVYEWLDNIKRKGISFISVVGDVPDVNVYDAIFEL